MKINLLAMLLLLCAVLQAQNPSSPPKVNVIPPSPEASALGKFGNIPVGLYTGVPQIGVPIYTVQSGDIQVPITLSYHASGIRVDEEASWVGLGWTLQAGGVITRTVRDKDDFIQDYYFNSFVPDLTNQKTPLLPYNDGCSLPTVDITKGHLLTLDLTQYVNRFAQTISGNYPCGGENVYDLQPDQYSYSFLNYSGKFIMERNKEIVVATQEKIEIKPFTNTGNATNPNDVVKWEIRTKDGFKYVFDKFETYQDADNCMPQIKTGWYLTQIISPRGNTVTFNYVVDTQVTQALGSVYERQAFAADGLCPGTETKKNLSERFKKYTTITLSSIDFDNGQVAFEFTGDREDLQNGKKLNTISIYRKTLNGTLVVPAFKKVNLNYEYFQGMGSTTDVVYGGESQQPSYFLKRLKLLSVQETNSGQSIPPYMFHYYDEGNVNTLPSKGSLSRDHWGYYNGALSNTTLIPKFDGMMYTLNSGILGYKSTGAQGFATDGSDGDKLTPADLASRFSRKAFPKQLPGGDRDPSAIYMKAFSLRDIVYPTGGRTEFKLEPHDYDERSSLINDESIIDIPDIREVDRSYGHNSWSELGQVKEEAIDLTNLYVPKSATGQINIYGKVTIKITFASTSDLRGLLNFQPQKVYVAFYKEDGSQVTVVDAVETNNAKCPDTHDYTCSCFASDPNVPGTVPKSTCELSQIYTLPPGKYVLKSFIATEAKPYITFINTEFIWNELVDKSENPISLAGGLRVSEIIDYDIDGSVIDQRKFNYHYQIDRDNDGFVETRSYGRRMSKPAYISYEKDTYFLGDAADPAPDFLLDCYRFVRTSDSVLPLNGSASGSVVGYDRVEVLSGKDASGNFGVGGKSVYEFENNPDQVLNYDLWRRPGIMNLASNRNGLQKRQTEYKYQLGRFFEVKEVINDYDNSKNVNTVWGIYRYVPLFLDPNANFSNTPCSVQLFAYPAMKSEWIQLSSTTEIDHDQNDVSKIVSKVTNYFYDNPNHLQVTRHSTVDSKGDVYETRMKYPLDYTNPSATVNTLITNYIMDPVIEQIQTVNGKFIGATGTKYDVNPANISQILPSEIYLLEADKPLDAVSESNDGQSFSDYQKRATYKKYDEKGNILEYSKEKDRTTAFLWGYNQTRPVAKIENATYAQVEAALAAAGTSVTAIQALDGDALRNTVSPLRAQLTFANITIYTYDPLVGMTTQTDPNGLTSHYEYDGLGRLVHIRDDQNKLLKSFDYKYYNDEQ